MKIKLSGYKSPTVLNDGNTVAWYDYRNLNTILRSSNSSGLARNYVSGWGDKLSYTEGSEMINQSSWYTLAYWDAYAGNWSQAGNTLSSNGSTGTINKTNFWQVGHTYKVTITITYNSGTLRLPNDNGGYVSGIESKTYTYYWTTTSTTMYTYSVLFSGTITSLSVKEVTVNTLYQNTDANKPLWTSNGIVFDGSNDYLKTAAFTLNQPEMIYMVVKPLSWTAFDTFIDGYSGYSNLQQFNSTPSIRMYAGGSVAYGTVNLNVFSIIRGLLSGATSQLQINSTAPVTGDVGIQNAGGITLGARYSNDAAANIVVKEVIIRKIADNATDEAKIYNYLKNKYKL